MKPKPDEAQNTKFSWEERSLLICQTTFEIFKFEKWPHPVCMKTKKDFHVSLSFHEKAFMKNVLVITPDCTQAIKPSMPNITSTKRLAAIAPALRQKEPREVSSFITSISVPFSPSINDFCIRFLFPYK